MQGDRRKVMVLPPSPQPISRPLSRACSAERGHTLATATSVVTSMSWAAPLLQPHSFGSGCGSPRTVSREDTGGGCVVWEPRSRAVAPGIAASRRSFTPVPRASCGRGPPSTTRLQQSPSALCGSTTMLAGSVAQAAAAEVSPRLGRWVGRDASPPPGGWPLSRSPVRTVVGALGEPSPRPRTLWLQGLPEPVNAQHEFLQAHHRLPERSGSCILLKGSEDGVCLKADVHLCSDVALLQPAASSDAQSTEASTPRAFGMAGMGGTGPGTPQVPGSLCEAVGLWEEAAELRRSAQDRPVRGGRPEIGGIGAVDGPTEAAGSPRKLLIRCLQQYHEEQQRWQDERERLRTRVTELERRQEALTAELATACAAASRGSKWREKARRLRRRLRLLARRGRMPRALAIVLSTRQEWRRRSRHRPSEGQGA